MNQYKLVRNLVPQLFELHHGYKPDTLEPVKAEAWPTKKTFIINKMNEEIQEFLDEATADKVDVNLDRLYEEAADVVATLEAMLAIYTPEDELVRERLHYCVADKDRKYGDLRGNKVIRISEEEKSHYYNNIKNKVEDEYGKDT